jgi:hypothetical protein
MVLKPVYLALFSLTLLAVIAGSGAVMALAGQGRDVMLFGAGVGVGMSLVSALSLELWSLSSARLEAMQLAIIKAVAAMQLGKINPRWFLNQSGTSCTPQNASDITLEIECRRLLDRTGQLLEKAVTGDGHCRYCQSWDTHSEDCPALAAHLLYQSGREKRVPWHEYKKTLPQPVGQRLFYCSKNGD